ncbi:HNH endonuclease [Bacillus sp. BRMEA1]|uniref:HNH endonuclease n=1 Tax=Neobacillus endophyticus TaxID=2738405 RepID=UPI0015649A35|nr:HNH endonuclease signature motif containing protein [Neobacillus endophyticus]NRD77374.1 HNH endonuclease [Neobacillus endophyticus]
MPKSRLPREVWFKNIRPIVWERDNRRCVRCNKEISLNECHIDHKQAGIYGNNKISGLRTLCFRCHALRACYLHRGLTSKAIEKGIIPPNWRDLTWDDQEL